MERQDGMQPRLRVGVIGGGLLPEQWGMAYEVAAVETAFGGPISVAVTEVGRETTVFSILRHGERHSSGHAVSYLGNVAALDDMDCDLVISLSLAGSLVDRFDVGDIVAYDDVIDFRRTCISFHDGAAGVHCAMAPLVSEPLRRQLLEVTARASIPFGGTMVVIEGPRYSTRAESRMYATLGGELICQTVAPECFLVREKQMDWCGVCLVTDRDTRDPAAMVSTDLIFEQMRANEERFAASILELVDGLRPYERDDRLERHRVPHQELAAYEDDDDG